MSHVLIVDDEPSICWSFEQLLSGQGHSVSVAASAEEAFESVEVRTPDAIVLDVRLPGMDGLTAINRFRELAGDVPIVVITAFGNLETAVQAIRQGAFDYLTKPFDLDQAAEVVERALTGADPKTRSASSERPADDEELIGSSPAMQQVFKQIALVAPTDVPVLITGESGTGKELVARAIHKNSNRVAGPFLPICLAALSPTVVESELFGHVKGAFTGAGEHRQGLLELGDGGTVLLDEIADTSPTLQVKLLRALEQHEVTPVGSGTARPTNVRLLAATNRSLPALIEAGEFREDFYFRLSVFHIHLPPLRERGDDVLQLAESFLQSVETRRGGAGRSNGLSAEVVEELRKRHWVGNVRELKNAIEHAAIVARGQPLRIDHLPAAASHANAVTDDPVERIRTQIALWAQSLDEDESNLYEQFLALVEPPILTAVLQQTGNNRAAAAQRLGMHRTTLRQKLRKYGLD